MFKVDLDLADVFQGMDDMVVSAHEAARPAAQAGAQVFYDEARVRVPVSKEARTYKGKTYQPGALKAAIYQAYSEDNSVDGLAAYHVSWNAKKAPHGHLIERGHWTKRVGKYGPLQPKWVPAQSFIRSAYEAKLAAAQQAMLDEFAIQFVRSGR